MPEHSPAVTVRTIFIVDDDAAVLDSMNVLLSSLGGTFLIRPFLSAAEFLAHVEAHGLSRTDCLLIDERMPGMGGMDLVELLFAQGRRCPFILTSGHGNDALRMRAASFGASAFIEKPSPPHRLVDAIETLFDMR